MGECEILKSLFYMKANRSLPELQSIAIYQCHEFGRNPCGKCEKNNFHHDFKFHIAKQKI